ncbi:hypothetical protein MO867_21120 [Microbulbifer sp. OS29]|uniref:Uncharacterized protein n=1 Tax=Microbulbifer okhotskensis TaxID=2926617 RepID=A0A9X2EVR3_9GAMM|nr:hypothetical protein [Microbulbifer okhotskensis]MCO1336833.1 hypothetical protein [Microbulbifer okhotskensis]
MTVYKINRPFDEFYTFTIKNAELGSKMPKYSPKFRAQPRLDQWVKPNAEFYAGDTYAHDKPRIPDITTWVTGNLVLNKKAFDILGEKLATSGEFLPVSVEGIDYYMLNTLKVIPKDGIDLSGATDFFDSGVNRGKINVGFDTSTLGNSVVFKTPTDHLLYSYCTEELKTLLEAHSLLGLDLEGVSAG